MADTELAYFAGLFDGEGCVAIYPKKYVVCVTNTDIRPLIRAKELWEGSLTCQKAAGRQYAVRDLWRWHLHGHAAVTFLEAIRPFVMIKGEQIDVYLSALKDVPKLGGKRAEGATDKIEAATAQLRLLKRGA